MEGRQHKRLGACLTKQLDTAVAKKKKRQRVSRMCRA